MDQSSSSSSSSSATVGNENGDANDGNRREMTAMEQAKEQWRNTVSHMETYPYVWASYGITWGALGLFALYKYVRIRKLEDQVRAHYAKLKLEYEAEEAALANKSKQPSSSSASPSKKTDASPS